MNEDEITSEEGAEEEAPATIEGDAFDAIDLPDIQDVQLGAELPALEDDATKYAVRFGIIGAG